LMVYGCKNYTCDLLIGNSNKCLELKDNWAHAGSYSMIDGSELVGGVCDPRTKKAYFAVVDIETFQVIS